MEDRAKVVLITAPSDEKAKEMARVLVESRLVACVNIIPRIDSIYFWQEKVHEDNESLMILKTVASNIAKLEKMVLGIHPYETPEFVVIDPHYVSERYAKWLANC